MFPFAGFLQAPEHSSKLSNCLHTAKVAKRIVLVIRRHPTTRDSIRAEELKEYGTRLLHVFGPANEGDLHTIV
jgi:hypothetical protein